MIKVEIFKEKDNFSGYLIRGHAYFDELGQDIVCASISILGQTALISLDEIGKMDPKFSVDDDEGLLDVAIDVPKDDTKRIIVNTIIGSMMCGVKGIVEMYPDYVELTVREVQSDDN